MNRKRSLTVSLFSCLGILLILNSPALSETNTKDLTMVSNRSKFQEVDLNKDGIISRSEWRDSIKIFEKIDINRDGVLTYVEYNAYYRKVTNPFARMEMKRSPEPNGKAKGVIFTGSI
jgi:Ca2+-binding EF-hand superfamily protein